MNRTVGVVIVTYNRLELLKITLCKVLAQSYLNIEILVVNNCSSDGTLDYLNGNEKVLKLNLDDNTGPAGGFYEGIRYFTETKQKDYVWLMDDDFFPSPSCLEELISKVDDRTVVFPFVRLKSFITHNKPSWSGPLIPSTIIEKVGYPMKELFFWAEDTEYFQVRIERKYGFNSCFISQAKGVHFTERKTNYRSAWRYYYEIRNTIYIKLHAQERSFGRVHLVLKGWLKLLGLILLKEKGKAKKLRFFLLGTYHGLARIMGKKVSPNAT